MLFGWQQNGNSGGDRFGTDPRAWSNSSENTMTLPRDLSWGADGLVMQRFVPELQKLRRQHWGATDFPLPHSADTGKGDAAVLLASPATRGVQLEISAKFSWNTTADFREGRFGLRVLANASSSSSSSSASSSGPWAEYTEIGFERTAKHSRVYVDRRRSSGGVRDADVRSGPWLNGNTSLSLNSTSLHLFVDRSGA